MTDGKDVVYQEGHRMEKNPDGAYTEELEVSVDGRKPQQAETAACSVDPRFRPDESSRPSIQAQSQKSAQRVLYVPTYLILCGSPAFPF